MTGCVTAVVVPPCDWKLVLLVLQLFFCVLLALCHLTLLFVEKVLKSEMLSEMHAASLLIKQS